MRPISSWIGQRHSAVRLQSSKKPRQALAQEKRDPGEGQGEQSSEDDLQPGDADRADHLIDLVGAEGRSEQRSPKTRTSGATMPGMRRRPASALPGAPVIEILDRHRRAALPAAEASSFAGRDLRLRPPIEPCLADRVLPRFNTARSSDSSASDSQFRKTAARHRSADWAAVTTLLIVPWLAVTSALISPFSVPPSKSMTNRLLFLVELSPPPENLRHRLDSPCVGRPSGTSKAGR